MANSNSLDKDFASQDATDNKQNIIQQSHDPQNVNPNNNIIVAVTGASGFLASHCIKQLLDKGYNVHGTVRGNPSADKYKWIYNVSSKLNTPNKLKLFSADLLTINSFNKCFTNVDYIFHVASPVIVNFKDPIKDLIEPAKDGTLNVLNCALKCNNKLKRIVCTSSINSIVGSANPNKIYTENDYNNEGLDHGAYSYSKSEAERAVWNWFEKNKKKASFDIVTINPALILGKHLNDGLKHLNESNNVLRRIITGDFPVRLNVGWTIVDVRDVASAHIFMIEGNINTSGRHLCTGKYISLPSLMNLCEQYCNQNKIKAKIPCCRCDCNWCWCFVMMIACCKPPAEATYLRGHVNKGQHFSNKKLRDLGFEFRDANSTLIYALDFLRDSGFVW